MSSIGMIFFQILTVWLFSVLLLGYETKGEILFGEERSFLSVDYRC